MMEIYRRFEFEAAHRLPHVPPDHRCARMHGHSFIVFVHVCGEVEPTSGWVMDYARIDEAFAPLFERLDHHCLNEVEGLENPTSESLARWIWRRLAPVLPGLDRIVVKETRDTGCIDRGPTDR